jgi:methionyl-tRNA formyltransferase
VIDPQTKMVFFGTPDISVAFLDGLVEQNLKPTLVVTQPDRPVGRKQILTPPPVKVAAQKHNLPLLQIATFKDPSVKDQLRALNADVYVVVAFGLIFPKSVLELPKHGCINVHASLLPKYRGASPIQAPILQGDNDTGITIMKMDPGMDTGPILQSITIPIDKNETTPSLTQKMMQVGPEFLNQVLTGYLAGKIKPTAQNNDLATYTKLINKTDGLIDWTQTADAIERKIRAYQPWPGAFTYWNDQKLDILEAEHSPLMSSMTPGQLIKLDGKIGITTGGGMEGNILMLKQVRLESKKAMSIETFLLGQPDFLKGSIRSH